jgi:nicotinate phosphoribosyltransferase
MVTSRSLPPHLPDALQTDLYELRMAASYLRRAMTAPATFSLFVRNLPPNRGFLVAGGLDECLGYLEGFRFEAPELEYLASAGFDDTSIEHLATLEFTGEVWAVPEGRVVLAGEPLLEVTAPLPEAQVVESVLLNLVGSRTALASKAARCRIAAGGRIELSDFSLRRAQGLDAGMAAARMSAVTGFSSTSNVEAARSQGLTPAGTMAHSYVEAFPTEAEAFRAYASDSTGPTTFLVDTYEPLAGARTAVRVIEELGLKPPLAVRLDSGDPDQLSVDVRRLLDAAGHPEVRIMVSGGLDEHDLARFVSKGLPIDVAGIGATLGTSADAPSLDAAYKLVQYGERPVMKLSAGKATLPGAKQVMRRLSPFDDVLALRDEVAGPGHERLLEPVMRDGKRLREPASVEASRQRFERDLAALPPETTDIASPVAREPRLSHALEALARKTEWSLRSSRSSSGA